FLVPTRSLRGQIGDEADLILCGYDRHAHAIRVHIGQTRAASTEVRGPLEAVRRVAVDPVLGIEDGEAIEVVP
ncbi:MAG TPA: hypothetical protein VHZ95_03465, partial [Polyangiales bacterium]|nr:hypothetical protein [Polyangiales bacterium]